MAQRGLCLQEIVDALMATRSKLDALTAAEMESYSAVSCQLVFFFYEATMESALRHHSHSTEVFENVEHMSSEIDTLEQMWGDKLVSTSISGHGQVLTYETWQSMAKCQCSIFLITWNRFHIFWGQENQYLISELPLHCRHQSWRNYSSVLWGQAASATGSKDLEKGKSFANGHLDPQMRGTSWQMAMQFVSFGWILIILVRPLTHGCGEKNYHAWL